MKKSFLILLLCAILFFSSFVSAASYLTENATWELNITALDAYVSIAFGDIDNDGDLDMIQVGCGSGTIYSCSVAGKSSVYINNGTSLVENQTWEQNLTTTTQGRIGLGDIDNDGDLDLVLIHTYTEVYENNGTAFIENATWQKYITGGDGASSGSVNLGDIDNDGDLDIVMMDMGSVSKSVWLNNGTNFINSSVWSQDAIESNLVSSVLVDVDNDNDLDSLITAYNNGPIYINNGTTLELSSVWGVGSQDHASLAVGDIDNDGDIDAFIMGENGPCGSTFFENNGSEMIVSTAWNSSGLFYGSAQFGDYNNDGHLDLVMNGQCGGTPYSYIYDGTGSGFIASEENIGGSQISSITWADLNGDNKLDLVDIANEKVYLNNITTTNTLPTSPISFSSSYNNRVIKLGWQNGSDTETPSLGLYYNLMIGNSSSNNNSIISGVYGGQGDVTGGGGTAFGYFGNMMQRKNFSLKVDRLLPGTNYTYYVQTIDTGLAKSEWSALQSFTTPADMEAPNITLNYPADNFNSSSYIVMFNATVWDNLNLSNVSLWGSWNGGWHLSQTNSSGVNNTDYNFTVDLTGELDGTYTWMIQAEDNSTNSINSTIRTFTLDTTKPAVSIVYPSVNNSNSSNTNLDINYTRSDSGFGLFNCWYSNDTYLVNTTLGTTCTNITTVTWAEGKHNVTVWANDSAGNYNFSTISFTIDTVKPSLNITYPINNSNSSNVNLDVNFSRSDANLASCWYSNDTYLVNTTLTSCTNITNIIWTDAKHNVTIWANDSVGNENLSRISFTIDTIAPSFSNPRNFTHNINVPFSDNFTAIDNSVEIDTYYLNDTSKFNVSQAGEIINNTNLSSLATYWINLSVNDSLGNLNSIAFFVNITQDFESPNVTLISPDNGASYSSNSQSINFLYNVSDSSEVLNCSLIVNGAISVTNSSINKSQSQLSFTQSFVPASYIWNVNCTDALYNIGNSSKRSFTVTAPIVTTSPSGGGGGGGGGTTTTPVITTPKEFDIDFSKSISETFEAQQGDVKTFSFNSQTEHSITVLSVGTSSITLIIMSEPIVLKINIGETKQVDVNEDGTNDFEINLISIVSGKASFSLLKLSGADITGGKEIEEEIKKEALFDVKVGFSNLFSMVKTGREVIAKIEVLNVNNIGQVDVVVDYYMTTKEDNKTKLAEGSDTLAVEAVASFVRSLRVPYETKAGRYLFNVDVKYQGKILASGNAEFIVIKTYEIVIVIGVVVLIIGGIFFYLWRIKRKEEKLEKKESRLERKIRVLENLRKLKNKVKDRKKWQKQR